jgi:hypothetical protein
MLLRRASALVISYRRGRWQLRQIFKIFLSLIYLVHWQWRQIEGQHFIPACRSLKIISFRHSELVLWLATLGPHLLRLNFEWQFVFEPVVIKLDLHLIQGVILNSLNHLRCCRYCRFYLFSLVAFHFQLALSYLIT